MVYQNIKKIINKNIIPALLICICGVFLYGFIDITGDVINSNIFINGVDVGGLTKEQAMKKLDNAFQAPLNEKSVSVQIPGTAAPVTYKFMDFKARYDFGGAVEQAYNYTRQGFMRERNDSILSLTRMPYQIDYTPDYTYDKALLEEKMKELERTVYIIPKNASMKRENRQFVITRGKMGRRLNTAETLNKVEKLLINNTGGSIEAVIDEIPPDITSDDLKMAQSLLGTFHTMVVSGETGRNTNITIAVGKINNTVIYPDEQFSTAKHFGAITPENGYKPAPAIVGGKLVEDVGGGVCQVSSTLYNAALFAELEIVQRQNHSMKVGYLDYAYDAAVAGEYIDLKFKNNTKYPVLIESFIENNGKVVVNIYGHESREPGRSLAFKNTLLETVPPGGESVKEAPTLPKGVRMIVSMPRDGYKYVLYKYIYINGREVERVLINNSYYKPSNAEVLLGTG